MLMDALKIKIGAAAAFFVSAALIGVNLTSVCGHVLSIFVAGTVFVGSIYYRSARCARAGVTINPNAEDAFQEGVRTLSLILVVAMAVFPGLIPWVFWLGLIHVVLATVLYN